MGNILLYLPRTLESVRRKGDAALLEGKWGRNSGRTVKFWKELRPPFLAVGGPCNTSGAQFVMADASIRLIPETISPAVLRALSNPRGSGAIPDDDGPTLICPDKHVPRRSHQTPWCRLYQPRKSSSQCCNELRAHQRVKMAANRGPSSHQNRAGVVAAK